MIDSKFSRWVGRGVLFLLALVGLLVAGIFFGYAMARLFGPGAAAPRAGLSLPGLLLGLPLTLGAILLTHELGHVLGGRLVGFRFLLLIVGPLKVTGGPQGLHFSLNRNLALAGGLAACLPTDLHQLNRRLLVMVAGGPVASLLLGASALGLYQVLRGQAPWDFIALTLGLGSLAIVVATLIPVTTAGFLTDGSQILSLLRNDATARLRALLLALQGESLSGKRPRDWSPAVLAQALAGQSDPTTRGAAHMMAYYVALDQGDVAVAAEHLAQTLALEKQLAKGFVEATYLEAAYFAAAHQRDAAAARRYLTQGVGSLAEPHSRLRAEAAVLLAEGHADAGRAKAAEAIRLAARSYDRGSALAEVAWIERDLLA